VKDQLKVIKEDVLYTLNKVYQILQVIKRFNQRLFDIDRLANKQAKQALTPRLACLPILEPPACLLAYLGKPAC